MRDSPEGSPGLAARTQRVIHPDGRRSVTVIGRDYLPVAPVQEFLNFLELDRTSPNTVRAYAVGLAQWLRFLDLTDTAWDAFPALKFGEFLRWVRTGDLPMTSRIGPSPHQAAAATVELRSAAVRSFYRYHAVANGLTGPYETLYSTLGQRRRNPYVGTLSGVADRGTHGSRPLFRVRSGPANRTPVLTPTQVQTILDAASTQGEDQQWVGGLSGLRNRFFFALLAETGMRMGEALGLRHSDIQLGRGQQPSIEIAPSDDHPHGARAKSGHRRRVYVGDDLEALYSAYVWALVDAGADLAVGDLTSHWVFVNSPTSTGAPFAALRPETVYATVRSIKARVHDLPPWTPHWLRHTHATALLLSGCPPHVVMRRLGHQDVQTTLSVYGWVTEDAELRAVADWQQFAHGWKEHLGT